MSLNLVALHGNLTRDPQLQYLPSKTALCEFGIACNRKWKDKEETFFADCKAFGKPAETINQYFTKGKPIIVQGRLATESWEGQDGKKRSATRIIVESFDFVGRRDDSTPKTERETRRRDEAPAPDGAPSGDDLPF